MRVKPPATRTPGQPVSRSGRTSRQSLLHVLVEGTDPGSLPVLIELDDVEHPVAVFTPVQQSVAGRAGKERFLGKGQARGKLKPALEVPAKFRPAVQAAIGPPPPPRHRRCGKVNVIGITGHDRIKITGPPGCQPRVGMRSKIHA